MKISIHIAFLVLSFLSFGQEWRDSLTVARKAYDAKNYEKAHRYYQSAQRKAPEGIDLSEEIGQSAYKSHQYEKAEKIYQQSTGSNTDKTKKAANYHNLGNARMRKKDYQGAVEAYKESLRNNPSDEETRYNLSEAIRQVSQASKQNKQQNQQQENPENQENNQNNKGENQQENQDGEKESQSNKSQSSSSDSKGNSKNENGSPKLQDKAVEKKLDELMKQEANTKRKLNGRSSDGGSTKSGKDW